MVVVIEVVYSGQIGTSMGMVVGSFDGSLEACFLVKIIDEKKNWLPTGRPRYGPTDGRTDGRTEVRTDVRTERRTDTPS